MTLRKINADSYMMQWRTATITLPHHPLLTLHTHNGSHVIPQLYKISNYNVSNFVSFTLLTLSKSRVWNKKNITRRPETVWISVLSSGGKR